MNEKERRKRLLEDLLLMSNAKHYGPLCRRAFDEIDHLAERLKAAHGHADECEAKIRFLHNQIDEMIAAKQS